MIVTKLDDEEMRVEASVTMTKIRWARKKMGVEDMTEEQAAMEYVAPTEEEQSLEDLIESEMRDVLATDGDKINMGRRRPIDMKKQLGG